MTVKFPKKNQKMIMKAEESLSSILKKIFEVTFRKQIFGDPL